MLFDIVNDPGERYDVSARHPDVMRDLAARFGAARAAFEPLGKHQLPDTLPTAN
jgi:hypothetical protein